MNEWNAKTKTNMNELGVSPPKNPKVESAKSYFQEMEKQFNSFLTPLLKYETAEFQMAKSYHNLSLGFKSLIPPTSVRILKQT